MTGVRVQQSLSGFIASDPRLSLTAQGDARFYVRVGQEQFTRLPDGGFEKTGVEFTDLVQFGKAAERAKALFRKGDVFVAEGYAREYDRTLDDGTVEHRSEFVAKKLGHDAARTSYVVNRAGRALRAEVEAVEPVPLETKLAPPAPVAGWPVVEIPR